jgi:hypothetical protein
MADQRSANINETSGSKERVAYDLMEKIHAFEKTVKKDRKYFIALYGECLRATSGQSIESTLT